MYLPLSYILKEETIGYGGKQGFYNKVHKSIKNNDSSNSAIWEMNNHIGTHIDCPLHFYENGPSITDYSLNHWVINGKQVQLIDVQIQNPPLITIDDLKKIIINNNVEILLIKTGYCYKRDSDNYWKNNPSLSPDAAKWISNNLTKLKFLGIDSISFSAWEERAIGKVVHKILLNPARPIILIEDMDLRGININTIFQKIIISPLFVNNGDASPCTIFAEVANED